MAQEIVKIPLTIHGVSLRKSNGNAIAPKMRAAIVGFFLNGGDKRKAMREAGYSEKTIVEMVFENKEVKRVVEKIQRKMARESDLDVNRAIHRLNQIAFSNLADLFNDDGTIRNPKELPPDLQAALDGIKVKMGFNEETGEREIKEIDYKTSPNLQALDMIFKLAGSYAPEKTEQKVSVDWDKELEGHDPTRDDVEEEIEAEYERLVDHSNGETDG